MSIRVMELVALAEEELESLIEDDSLNFDDFLEDEDDSYQVNSLEGAWGVIWFILTDSAFDRDELYAPSVKVYDEEGEYEISTSFLSEAELVENDDSGWSECYYLSAGEVLQISRALNAFSLEDFAKRFSSTIFKKAASTGEIFGDSSWSKEENYTVLIDSYYKPFVEFFSNAATQGEAIIYAIG
ncbi:MAG: DUF1877 family protein [Pseudomonadales bacterium]|nr:DUF1877 family protein [Pseudomonadales bacterium]